MLFCAVMDLRDRASIVSCGSAARLMRVFPCWRSTAAAPMRLFGMWSLHDILLVVYHHGSCCRQWPRVALSRRTPPEPATRHHFQRHATPAFGRRTSVGRMPESMLPETQLHVGPSSPTLHPGLRESLASRGLRARGGQQQRSILACLERTRLLTLLLSLSYVHSSTSPPAQIDATPLAIAPAEHRLFASPCATRASNLPDPTLALKSTNLSDLLHQSLSAGQRLRAIGR